MPTIAEAALATLEEEKQGLVSECRAVLTQFVAGKADVTGATVQVVDHIRRMVIFQEDSVALCVYADGDLRVAKLNDSGEWAAYSERFRTLPELARILEEQD